MQAQAVRHFAKKILLPYALIIAILAIGIDFVFTKSVVLANDNMNAAKVIRMKEKDFEQEIPIIGSSRALENFIPDSIHPNCFNYGIEGTGGKLLVSFLKMELAKKRKTPIILSFDCELDSTTGDYLNYLPIIHTEQGKYLIGKNYRYYHFLPFFRYFGGIEVYLKSYFNQKYNFTKEYNKGGAFELNSASDQQFQDWVRLRLNTPAVWENTIYANELLSLLKSTNRKFFFVISPFHNSYFQSFQNIQALNMYLDKVKAIPNVEVLDLSSLFSDDSLFFDTAHLNIKGAKLFSTSLRRRLAEIDNTFL